MFNNRFISSVVAAGALFVLSAGAAVNNPPTANPDNYTVNEDVTLTVAAPGVLGNDTDPENSPLTATLLTAPTPTNGTLSFSFTSNGSFTYRPATNFYGVVTFTYRCRDGSSNSLPTTVTITVNPVNDAPLAANNSYSVNSDSVLTINAPGVLANDADVDGDPLSALLAGGPTHGALALNPDGSFTYTPVANYSGSDSFTYRASDGQTNSALATVTLTVVPAPIVITTPPANETVCAGGTASFNVAATGTALTYQWFKGAGTLTNQTNSTLTLNSVTAADAATYRVRLLGATNSVTNSATLTVNLPVSATPLTNLVRYTGSIAIFDTTASGTGPFTYAWLKNGSIIPGQTGSSLVLNNLNTGDSASYSSVVSGACGSVTNSATLTVAACFNAVDVMLVIDRSGSMSGQAYTDARTASTNFVRNLHLTAATNDQAGLVSYNPTATLNHVLTNNAAALEQAIHGLGPATNGTCISCGLTAAQAELVSPRHRADALPILVLLSDGVPHDFDTPSNALYNAQQAKNAGTRVFTVGLSTGVDQVLMSEMASSPGDFYYTTNSAQLAALFDAIATIICRPPTNIFGPSDVTVCAGASTSFNVAASGCAAFTYQWRKDGAPLAGQTNNSISLSNVTAANAGLYSVVVSSACRTVTNSAMLTVNQPAVIATPLANQLVHLGSNVTFNAGLTGTSLSYQWFFNPAGSGGAGVVVGNGSTFTINNFSADQAGVYCVVAVSAVCGGPVTNCATLGIQNRAPLAGDDAYTTAEDTTLTVPAAGVLANDSDPDGDALSAALVSGVAHGTLSLGAAGSFLYAPALNFHGTDMFTYRASDGRLSSGIATVTITVTSVNDAPVAVNDAYTTAEDTTLTIPAAGILANDSDVDGDSLSALLVSNVAHGLLNLSASGAFTYTPSLNYTGADTFTYRASDGGLSSDLATVTITITPVNDAPVAVNDAYTTAEDTALTIPPAGILANDSDADGDSLTTVLVTGVAHGTLSLSANGAFTYAPSLNYTGVDTFTYRATDGLANSGVATVTITITPVNDGSTVADDTYTTVEDTTLTIAAPGILANDGDVDGDPLTTLLVTDVAHGILNLSTNGAFIYTPSLNYTGLDVFTYRVTDGLATSEVATVTITITPVNDTPVATDDAYTTAEDTTLNISVLGVLANDSDVDGDTLAALLVTDVAHGTLSLNASGAFIYTPSLNYTGVDTFTYRATDGLANSDVATVTIIITPVNDAPVAANDAYTTAEDTTLTVLASGILANDSDVDGDPLTTVLVTDVAHGLLSLGANGSFIYTPSLNYTGVDTFTYRATDGLANSDVATVTITITPVNDAPVAADDAYTTSEDTTLTILAAGILANDSDVDGDALSSALVSNVTHGTLALSPNGSFIYTPAADFHGEDSFTYRAYDGELFSAAAVVRITVLPANDAPVAANDAYTTAEDTALTVAAPGVLANDTDVDGDPLSVALVGNVSHGTLALSANGSFLYTPGLNFNGTDTFTYRASDGQATSSVATVTITVTPVNDPPVTGVAGDNYSVLEDATLTVAAPGVLGNDSDVDGDALTAIMISGVAHGTLTLNANGSFTYTPVANYFGNDSFTYAAHDGQTSSAPATVNITIIPVNDAPVFVAGANQRVNFNTGAQSVPNWATGLSAGPANESEQTVHFVVSNNNPSLFAAPPAVSPAGALTYTPAGNLFGVATVTVSLQDDGGTANGGADASAPLTFTITLNGPPVVSIINPTNNAVFVGTNTITVVAQASDPDSVVTNVMILSGTNVLGSFAQPPYFVTLPNAALGIYLFRAIAVDDLGLRATSSVVTVTVTQSPPVTALGPIVLNHQNGLFEQFVRISNSTPRSFPNGMRLFITKLDSTNRVYNATGTNAGVPYIDVRVPLPALGTLDVLVQYYVPNPRSVPNPTLVAEPLPFTVPVAPAPVFSPAGKVNGGLVLQFTAVNERLYYLQSSTDLMTWTTLPGLIQGTGGSVKTTNAISGGPKFFRVLLLP